MLNEKAKKLASKYVREKSDAGTTGNRSLQAEINMIGRLITSLSGRPNYSKKELIRVALKVNELQTVISELSASK